MPDKQLALVTGASTGIGLELAKCTAEAGFDLVIAAGEAAIESDATELRPFGGSVQAVQAVLATTEGSTSCRRPADRPLAMPALVSSGVWSIPTSRERST